MITGAVLLKNRHPEASTAQTQLQTITAQQLSANDGKGNNKCYVALDGKVYEIKEGKLWQNGQHITSEGKAYCGADLSKVIDKAPHGRTKLETLTVVGQYNP